MSKEMHLPVDFAPAMAQAGLDISTREDGTITVVWNEDWDTEISKDTFTLDPQKHLTHISYFENNTTAGTKDVTLADTLSVLRRISTYLDLKKDKEVFDIINKLISSV